MLAAVDSCLLFGLVGRIVEVQADAALVHGIEVMPASDLAGVIAHVTGTDPISPQPPTSPTGPADLAIEHDLCEVHGQEEAKRALEIAAAGGHHVLMSGSPGSGKTMLARCLPGIQPSLELDEALEVAQIRSLLGELPQHAPLDWTRPFRAPHHGIS